MINPFEYLPFSNRKQWKPQFCDVPDRYVDTTEVLSSEPVDWPAELANETLHIPAPPSPWDGRAMMSGRPLQRVDPEHTVWITERNTYRGATVDRRIPRPIAKHFWIEGMPTRGGAHDRHWIGVADDGRTWEIIGLRCGLVFRGGKWWRPAIGRGCLAVARYVESGLHHEDRPVIKSGDQVSSLLLNRWDQPHRLAITLTDYAKETGSDGTADWSFPAVGDWVCLDAARVPAGLDLEQQRFANTLVQHGAIIGDRGGHNQLSVVPGAQWANTTLSELDLKLSDFRKVST